MPDTRDEKGSILKSGLYGKIQDSLSPTMHGPVNDASDIASSNDRLELSSMSSTGSESGSTNNQTYSKIIQDFKNEISKRETPRHLVMLSRLLLLILLLTIAISSIDYHFKQQFLNEAEILTA